jgi:hypothetical protein
MSKKLDFLKICSTMALIKTIKIFLIIKIILMKITQKIILNKKKKLSKTNKILMDLFILKIMC